MKARNRLISTESTLLLVTAAVAAASIASIAVATTATISTTATAASTEATATTAAATAEATTTVVVVELTAGGTFRVGTVGASYLNSLCATIITGLDEELNGLSFTEGAETFGLDSTLVDKEILTASCKEKKRRNTGSALSL
jgi:hypothetical protein